MGSSYEYNRRDFFANGAASIIPKMFEVFDDHAASAFVEAVKSSPLLRRRIESPTKLTRLRSLANIVLERVSGSFSQRKFLEVLIDEDKIEKFLRQLG